MAGESVREEVGRIAPLDGLRGIAVLWVIAFHVNAFARARRRPMGGAVAVRPVARARRRRGIPRRGPLLPHLGIPARAALVRSRGRGTARALRARLLRAAAAPHRAGVLREPRRDLRGGAAAPARHPLLRSDLYVYLYNAFAHALFLHNTTPLTSGSMEVNGALWDARRGGAVLSPHAAPGAALVRWGHAAVAASLALAVLWHLGVGHRARRHRGGGDGARCALGMA